MGDVTLDILRDPEAEGLPLPEYQSAEASGLDLRAAVADPLTIPSGAIRLAPTGLRMALPPGYEAQVRSRSGLALKHGIWVVNSPGTIDSDYRGPVGVILGNFGDKPFVVNRGDRIAQLVVQKVERARVRTVEVLGGTERGSGGFGSSGV